MNLGRIAVEIFIIVMLSNILLLVILLYAKIYITLRYQRDDTTDDLVVMVHLFKKLLVYKMQLPAIEIEAKIKDSDWLQSKFKAKQKTTPTERMPEEKFIRKTINFYIMHPGRIRHVFRLFRYGARLYMRLMGNMIVALYCEQLIWKTSYGAGDAGMTGVINGMLWTIKGLMMTRLKKRVIFIKKPIINVNPIFGADHLKVNFQCIFSIRLGNVINTIRNLYVIK